MFSNRVTKWKSGNNWASGGYWTAQNERFTAPPFEGRSRQNVRHQSPGYDAASWRAALYRAPSLRWVTTNERLQPEALPAERRTILQLRNDKIINDNVLRRIRRDLDLAELRLNRT